MEEVSDPVRWDVDGLSIIDPRQVQHIIELVEPMTEYGFDRAVMERAFIPFRIDKDLGGGRVHLARVKESLFESDEKLFALPDLLDEENGPYADFLDHITRTRVKMLNSLFDFEQKLTVDEMEDEIREAQNIDFMEGKAVHVFNEITAILDYTPAGWESEEEGKKPASDEDELEDEDLPALDEAEEEKLKNDQSLKWDEEDEDKEGEDRPRAGGDEDLAEADEDDDRPKRSGRR
ncbi:MAG: hypothetical protein A3G75_15900 [Verrucomicrobia bacterium RIFCSPLOWO2_12_FULL_64_8]|nr:MAG: hypothetical protein A3G75_15900 [Verrucomicrobia bacterium RIFCSPLOWO2_12_FULL_64_8]